MKLTISSSELLKGLMNVSKAIPAKAAQQILDNFLFEADQDKISVTASDGELTLKTVIAADEVKEAGRIAIPARHILELLKELPDQPLKINTVSDSSFECVWASGSSSLPFFPAEDYPSLTNIAADTALTIDFPAQTLTEGISRTIFATADDEIRPALNGIFFDISEDSTTLVASDASKLVCYTATDVKSDEKASFILHRKPATILRSIIGKDVDTVSITFDTKNAMFTFEGTTVICRLIVGKFPRYRDVIPQNNSNTLKIDRTVLLNTVRRVAVCASKASNHIKLDLSEGSLVVSAQDLGFSLSAYEKVSCSYEGEPLTIGFKSTFVIEMLSNMGCTEVIIKFADSRRAALIVPSDDEAESEKSCGIIMPIMV
ncbi:MAG: DNA polymerase III subunit beta [Bacteroidales bacterium]|nr:DNA polymerase III subunit beta [Bacteroidales bacterium]